MSTDNDGGGFSPLRRDWIGCPSCATLSQRVAELEGALEDVALYAKEAFGLRYDQIQYDKDRQIDITLQRWLDELDDLRYACDKARTALEKKP